MKNYLSIMFIILIAGIGLIPFIDGYMFKQLFIQRINSTNALLAANGINIDITEYKLGWLNSSVKLTIHIKNARTARFSGNPISIVYDSVISHGPIVRFKQQPELAYAKIETDIKIPDELRQYIDTGDSRNIFSFEAIVSLNGNKVTGNGFMPTTKIGDFGKSDGFSLDTSILFANNYPVKLDMNLIIGAFFFNSVPLPGAMTSTPEIASSPINLHTDLELVDNIWVSSYNVNIAGITQTWNDGTVTGADNLKIISNENISNHYYNITTNWSANVLQLKPIYSIYRLSQFNMLLAIKNLKISGIEKMKTMRDELGEAYTGSVDPTSALAMKDRIDFNDFQDLVSPDTSIEFKLEGNSNAGSFHIMFDGRLLSMPKTLAELEQVFSIKLNTRIATSLLQTVLENYYNANPGYGSMDQANAVIDKLINAEIVKLDKNDYVIEYNKKGLDETLNGKAFNPNDVATLLQPPSPPPPPPTASQKPQPAMPPASHRDDNLISY